VAVQQKLGLLPERRSRAGCDYPNHLASTRTHLNGDEAGRQACGAQERWAGKLVSELRCPNFLCSRQQVGVLRSHFADCDLGFGWALFQVFGYVAAGSEHSYHDRYLPDGIPHTEHAEPGCARDPLKAG